MRILLAFFIFTVFSVPAYAQINDEGAAKLKTIAEKALSDLNSPMPGGLNFLEYEGEPSVEQTDSYYALTLPHLKINYTEFLKVDLGIVSINAVPHDTPGQWKMSFALPTPIILLNSDATEVSKLHISTQRAAGIWDEDAEGFVKLDAVYGDLNLNMSEVGLLNIPNVQIRQNLEKDTNSDSWSGDMVWLSEGLNLEFANTEFKLDIDTLKLEATLDQYSFVGSQIFQETMAEIIEEIEKQQDILIDQNASQEQKEEAGKETQKLTYRMTEAFLDLIANIGNGVGSKYILSGFSMQTPEKKTDDETIPAGMISLDQGMFNFALGGLDEEKAFLDLEFSYSNGSAEPALLDHTNPLAPSDVNIDLRLGNIPFVSLVEAAKPALQSMEQNPDLAMIVGIGFFTTLPTLLSEAGVVLTIENNYLEDDNFRIELDGSLQADKDAVFGVSGTLSSSFAGLDDLIAETERVQFDPEIEETEELTKLLNDLKVLKRIGRPIAGSDPMRYTYDIEVKQSGDILFNGESFLGLFEGIEFFPAKPENDNNAPI